MSKTLDGLVDRIKARPRLTPEYRARHRVPKWNIEPNILTSGSPSSLTKRAFPNMSKADHVAKFRQFAARVRKVTADYWRVVDKALKDHGGQKGPIISGAYQDHFPESVKNRLRKLAHGMRELQAAADAHWRAAGYRTTSPLR